MDYARRGDLLLRALHWLYTQVQVDPYTQLQVPPIGAEPVGPIWALLGACAAIAFGGILVFTILTGSLSHLQFGEQTTFQCCFFVGLHEMRATLKKD